VRALSPGNRLASIEFTAGFQRSESATNALTFLLQKTNVAVESVKKGVLRLVSLLSAVKISNAGWIACLVCILFSGEKQPV